MIPSWTPRGARMTSFHSRSAPQPLFVGRFCRRFCRTLLSYSCHPRPVVPHHQFPPPPRYPPSHAPLSSAAILCPQARVIPMARGLSESRQYHTNQSQSLPVKSLQTKPLATQSVLALPPITPPPTYPIPSPAFELTSPHAPAKPTDYAWLNREKTLSFKIEKGVDLAAI